MNLTYKKDVMFTQFWYQFIALYYKVIFALCIVILQNSALNAFQASFREQILKYSP